jgi:TrmH family RNA methyltransferase
MNIDITSPANPKIKWVKSLHKNSTRKKEGVFLVEGAKEIAMAIDGGYQPHSFFMCPEIAGQDLPASDAANMFTISKECFEKISYRSGSDGLLAVFHATFRTLNEITFSDNPLLMVVEGLEKPGNIGAVIRSADGSGADAVIICNEKADIFNPNAIRASVGTVFTKQVVVASNKETLDFLQKHEITPFGALLSPTSKNYSDADFTAPTALIVGAEHDGLTKFWQQHSQPIAIPMHGVNDSLNVSNAAAILLYEATRQRTQASTN